MVKETYGNGYSFRHQENGKNRRYEECDNPQTWNKLGVYHSKPDS